MTEQTGMPKKTALGGLFRRKELWVPSLGGCLLILAVVSILIAGFLLHAQKFLAVSQPVKSDILIVEGWIPDYALQKAWEQFQADHDQLIVVTGVRGRNGSGMDLNDTYAGWGAERLQKIAEGKAPLVAVPAFAKDRDRTYTSAVAAQKWLANRPQPVKAINVLTLATHARRTRLLYEKAFGSSVQIGIISTPNEEYDPNKWWVYSEGVKEMIGEGAGYIYARFFFHPKPPE